METLILDCFSREKGDRFKPFSRENSNIQQILSSFAVENRPLSAGMDRRQSETFK